MTTMRPIPVAEFRAFLQGLGYIENPTESALVFRHPQEGLLVFRVYRDDEAIDVRDLVTTRKFLELRGILDPATFDTLVWRATTPA